MKSFLQKLSLLLVGVAVPVALAEVALRLAPEDALTGPEFDREEFEYVPAAPSDDAADGGADEAATAGEDQGPEPFHLAIIGDSFTVGDGVGPFDAYPARLERLLNLNPGVRPVEVWVLAEKGSSTYDQLRFLRRAVKFDAEMILLGIFLNDPEDRKDPEFTVWRERFTVREPRGFVASLARRSHLVRWVYYRFETLRSGRAGQQYYHYLFDPEGRPWKGFKGALWEFADMTRRNDLPFAAVIFPGMEELGPDYPHRFAHRRISDLLTELDVPHLDLLAAFNDKSPYRMSAIPGVDGHPSEIGHRVAARAILRWLEDEELLPAELLPRRGKDLGSHYRRLYERRRPGRRSAPEARSEESATADSRTSG